MEKHLDGGIDPTRCPLCGADNRCAMEIEKLTGQPQPPCWCVSETFSSERLAQLPRQAEGAACICQACVRSALQINRG